MVIGTYLHYIETVKGVWPENIKMTQNMSIKFKNLMINN